MVFYMNPKFLIIAKQMDNIKSAKEFYQELSKNKIFHNIK